MTEVKIENSAEAQKTENLEQSIFYLAEREANLSKYSDKLRENLITIAKKLPNISLNIQDTEAYRSVNVKYRDEWGTTEQSYLYYAAKDGLQIVFRRFEDLDPAYQIREEYFFANVSREELKTLVQSGRLTKFLAYVAQKLAEAEAEYKQVADAAEKMANSFQ